MYLFEVEENAFISSKFKQYKSLNVELSQHHFPISYEVHNSWRYRHFSQGIQILFQSKTCYRKTIR